MNLKDIEELVGLPWAMGKCGPSEYDCWGLLRHIYKKFKGISLKHASNFETLDVSEYSRIIEEESSKWDELKKPTHLCAVAVARNRFLSHVGIFIDMDGGLILHSEQGRGVVIEPASQLRKNGFKTIKYYDYSS